jgi:hypothetical protein
MSLPKRGELRAATEGMNKALGKAINFVEAAIPRKPGPPMRKILAGLRELRRKVKRLDEPQRHPMKCVCGKKFRGFETWRPHFKKRHPILDRRYSAIKGKKGSFARTNLMLRMMRAASA